MVIPVIIVDDDATDRMIARRRLERSGRSALFTSIREYAAGDLFLAAVARGDGWQGEAPPLILMDVNMPGLDGFETVDGLGGLAARTGAATGQVVMMTASLANPGDAVRARTRSMIRGLVAKPLSASDIERIVAGYGGAAASP